MIRAGARLAVLAAALVAGSGAAGTAWAGAWTLEPGEAQLITTLTYYRATREFGSGGGRKDFADDGEFTSLEVNPYLQYGLRSDLTLIASLVLRRVEFSDDSGSDANAGLADPEIGLRYRLSPPEWATVWSVQGLVKLPVSTSSSSPPLSNEQLDLEGRLLVGRGFAILDRGAFWNVELGYRFRAEEPADEIRLDATLGVSVTPALQVIGELTTITGLRNGESFAVRGNPNVDPNYDLYKGRLSLVYRLGPAVSLQAGYEHDLAGRNTGAGGAAFFAVWWMYPGRP